MHVPFIVGSAASVRRTTLKLRLGRDLFGPLYAVVNEATNLDVVLVVTVSRARSQPQAHGIMIAGPGNTAPGLQPLVAGYGDLKTILILSRTRKTDLFRRTRRRSCEEGS